MNSPERIPPPGWARQLLTRLHPEETLEEVEGDLDELYTYWYQRAGKRQATLRYLINVVSLLTPFVRRRQPKQDPYHQPSSLHANMFRNYLKIAWRNLAKNKGYSFIHIGGLALGTAVAMLIGLWVHNELTFDRYHRQYDHVAQVMRNITVNGQTFTDSHLPYPLGEVLKREYGNAFKQVVAAWPTDDYILSAVDKHLSRRGAFMEAGAPGCFP
jgi:putative ABC transport system permease protein